MQAMGMLETEKLTRRFGQMTAVDQLSIGVETGEVFGLLGANGTGKMVTLDSGGSYRETFRTRRAARRVG